MDENVVAAIEAFWSLRDSQIQAIEVSQGGSGRDAVVGGQHLNAIRDLLVKALIHLGVPSDFIHTSGPKKNMPGYFRPTKNWDLAVSDASGNVVGLFELKSQVGSFGNNANNRAEEAVGNPIDISVAFSNGLLPVKPWLAYIFVIEDAIDSRKISLQKQGSAYDRDPVFASASYLDRIGILAERAMSAGLYDAAWVIATGEPGSEWPIWTELSKPVSWEEFRSALRDFVQGQDFSK